MLNKSISIDNYLENRKSRKRQRGGRLCASYSHNLLYGHFRLVPVSKKDNKDIKSYYLLANFCKRYLIVKKKKIRRRVFKAYRNNIRYCFSYKGALDLNRVDFFKNTVDLSYFNKLNKLDSDNTVAIRQAIESIALQKSK